jgi:hypothetical protein
VYEARVQTFKPGYPASPPPPIAAKPSQPLQYDSGMQQHNRHPLFISMMVDSLRTFSYTYYVGLRSIKYFNAACISHSIEIANIRSTKRILTYRGLSSTDKAWDHLLTHLTHLTRSQPCVFSALYVLIGPIKSYNSKATRSLINFQPA